jgi:hypothetical protein
VVIGEHGAGERRGTGGMGVWHGESLAVEPDGEGGGGPQHSSWMEAKDLVATTDSFLEIGGRSFWEEFD